MAEFEPIMETANVWQRPWTARLLAILAGIISLVGLSGWFAHWRSLSGFGFPDYPDWPASITALLCLAGATILFGIGRRKPAIALLIVPFFVGCSALVAYIAGIRSPMDGLLLGQDLAGFTTPDPGRPGVIPSLSLVLLSASLALLERPRDGAELPALILGATALGLNLLSVAVLTVGFGIGAQHVRIPGSLPDSLSAICLCFALSARLSQIAPRRPDLFGADQGRARSALPLLIVLPVVLLPLVDTLGKAAKLTTLEIELIASAGNLLLGVGVWAWVNSLVTRERQAMDSLVRTLDTLPLILTNRDSQIVHWSAGCEQMLGWRNDEVVGRKIVDVLQIRSPAAAPTDAESGLLVREVDASRRDGTRFPLVARVEWIDTPRGRLRAVALTDMSTLNQTRAALQRSEAALEMALESHQITMFDWDVTAGTLGWTAAAEERLGLTPGEMRVFATWESLVHPDDRQDIARTIAEATRSQSPRFVFRYRMVTRLGETRMIEGSGHCFYDEDGNLARCIGVNIDVTEREEHEMALATSEAQLRAIVETVQDAMVIVDSTGIVQSVSANAELLFGYPAPEIVGHNIAMLMPGAWPLGRDVDDDGDGEQPVGRTRTALAVRRDGTELPIELSVGETRIGRKPMLVCFARDISARVEAAERLEELNSAYAHSARLNAVGELASSLAHELNQPLAASSNFLAAAEAMLERHEDTKDAGALLGHASAQILRAGEIIRRLRDFIAKSETEIRIEPLEPTIREAVELGLTGNRQLRIDTSFDFDPAAPCFLGDRIQVEQVIVNLVRNAAQALRTSPLGQRWIDVATRYGGDDVVEVIVADNGPGLPDMVLEQLAKPFLTTKGGEGLGLGISICRRIVEAHGGTFAASNRPEGGARFTFTLPFVAMDPEEGLE